MATTNKQTANGLVELAERLANDATRAQLELSSGNVALGLAIIHFGTLMALIGLVTAKAVELNPEVEVTLEKVDGQQES